MKLRLFLMSSLFFGVSASACPNLSGHYFCQYSDGSQDVVLITQFEADGTTTYLVNDNPLIANGVSVAITDDITTKNQVVRYSCDDHPTKLGYYYEADQFKSNIYAGHIAAQLLFSKDEAGNLIIEDKGVFTFTDGIDYPWARVTRCPPFVAPTTEPEPVE